MFLAPNFFGGAPLEFLEWDYKLRPDSDHLAKFQGDRSRDLGECVAKKKDTSAVKYKPVRNGCSGRPNYVRRLVTFIYRRFRNILTYLLTLRYGTIQNDKNMHIKTDRNCQFSLAHKN